MIKRLPRHVQLFRNANNHLFRWISPKAFAHGGTPQLKPELLQHPEVISLPDIKYSPGKDYENFRCVRAESIPEFGLMSYTFIHNNSKTELWFLENRDPNNGFAIDFRTTPFDSTGLPHILEHNVLSGSQKYPVQETFFKMLNRSVATYMNALTGPDYTIYPFSSMNETDFRNIQKVYLDAVFRPNLRYLDFLQEGWRLEHSVIDDMNSDYVIKGVVFSEMKGASSANSYILRKSIPNNLFPDTTYGFLSAGSPLEIPKVTHDDLIAFHKKYYHPSNARIYCYGCFNLERTLSYIDAEYLSKFEAVDTSFSKIPNQTPWENARSVHISSRFDNLGPPFEKQNQIAIAVKTCDVTDVYETFVLNVLTELLVRGSNAPFYKNLIEPNFSGGYNSVTYFDRRKKDTFFCIGLQDLKVADFSRVQEIFEYTIAKVVEEGFRNDHIESVLQNIELSLKHQSPRTGLAILFNCSAVWNHDGDVVDMLRVSKILHTLRANLKDDPKYLQKKVEHYFVKNKHRLTLTMSPDENYELNFREAEQAMLMNKVASLTAEERRKIYDDGLQLKKLQNSQADVNLLPCLKLEDVKEPPKRYAFERVQVQNIPTQICTVPTNNITYLKCLFDSAKLSPEEIILIPLFCSVIGDMGTKHYNYRAFDKLVTSKTSGYTFKLHFTENIQDNKKYDLGVVMISHALDNNAASMFDLAHELLCNFTLEDVDRLNMLIESYMTTITTSVTKSSHIFAMRSCCGLVTDSARLKAQLTSVEHINVMRRLLKDSKPENIKAKLTAIGKKLFNEQTMRVAINTSEEFVQRLMELYKSFLKTLPRSGFTKKRNTVNFLKPSCKQFVMNIPVNHCSKCIYTVPFIHEDHPALRILARLLTAKYLIPLIREQNNAYGAGARLDSDGMFSFFSYRDPNTLKTFDCFDNVYRWFIENEHEITEQSGFEAKLGVLQQLDAPVEPGNLGTDFFLYDISQELFETYRQRTLDVTLQDIKDVLAKYFKEKPKRYGKYIMGPENPSLKQSDERWSKVV